MAKKKRNDYSLDTYDFEKFRKAIKRDLTDNVKVNFILSPLYFILIFFLIKNDYSYPIYSPFIGSITYYSLLSTIIYIYASHYYQPDLDVHTNRPGMGHFPLGKTIGYFALGRFFKWVLFPINRIWYYLWLPYARLFTHRGISHYPIISTMLRAVYLLIIIGFLNNIFLFLGIKLAFLEIFIYWLKNFFIKGNFFHFILFNFPIYISDCAHILVDYYDSVKKGTSFCPPKLPRGILYQIYETIKGGRSL